MGIGRLIFLAVVIYFFYKGIKFLVKVFTERQGDTDSFINTNYDKKKPRSKINKQDIIDADFEDLDEPDNSK